MKFLLLVVTLLVTAAALPEYAVSQPFPSRPLRIGMSGVPPIASVLPGYDALNFQRREPCA